MTTDRLNKLLQERIDRGEFCERLPTLVDGPSGPNSAVTDSVLQKARLQIEALLAEGRLGKATAIIQTSYEKMRHIDLGVYEHEFLLRPVLEKFADGMDGMANMTESAEQAGYWHRDAPHNPFSAGLFALSLQQLGCSHSGTNWLDPDADESNILLEQCIEHAAQTLDEAQAQHGDHWFWRYASLRVGLHDHRDRKDHWLRFERAVESQPLSADVWTNFAYQLLPRWHGEAGDLTRISKRAWMATRKTDSAWLYLEVFKMVNTMEHGKHELELLEEVATLLIKTYAGSQRDADRTLVISAHASRGNYAEAVKLMSQMKSLHQSNWLVGKDPRWVMGMAEIHAPVNTVAA